jgi:hypothetical protein
MSDPQAYFERLGRLIEGRWSASYFDERTLPSIAVAALSEEPPHEFVSDEDIARWAIMAESLGRQPNADFNFGEPPLTVFAGRRFYIEALYWLDGTTSIHQHAFDGAFCVLGGGSVHSTYSFEERDRLSSRLILGDLLHQNSEILRPGSVRAINAGGGSSIRYFTISAPRCRSLFALTARPGSRSSTRMILRTLGLRRSTRRYGASAHTTSSTLPYGAAGGRPRTSSVTPCGTRTTSAPISFFSTCASDCLTATWRRPPARQVHRWRPCWRLTPRRQCMLASASAYTLRQSLLRARRNAASAE